MASSAIFYTIFTAFCIITVKSAFVTVKCETKNVGHFDQQSLLECVVQTSKDVQNPVIRVVAWKKLRYVGDEDGRLILGYKGGERTNTPGYMFAEPSWSKKNMNVSLLISKTAVADDGVFSCMVVTDSGDHTNFTNLTVQANYSAPTIRSIPENIVPDTDSVLICESHGGYPKGDLRWFVENTAWRGSSNMEVTNTPSGLFQLTSRFELKRGSTFSKYTCVVFNASGGKEEEITFDIHRQPTPSGNKAMSSSEASKIVAPLVVIGSLIAGLLFALLCYKRRSQREHVEVPTNEPDIEEGSDQPHENEGHS